MEGRKQVLARKVVLVLVQVEPLEVGVGEALAEEDMPKVLQPDRGVSPREEGHVPNTPADVLANTAGGALLGDSGARSSVRTKRFSGALSTTLATDLGRHNVFGSQLYHQLKFLNFQLVELSSNSRHELRFRS